jgi:hypothetical protein
MRNSGEISYRQLNTDNAAVTRARVASHQTRLVEF